MIRLTPKGEIYYPSFSSDGKKIVFLADLSPEGFEPDHIYTLDLSTSEIDKISDYEGKYVTYIDGGRKIMFYLRRNRHGGDICTINSDGSGFKVITRTY